jgi:hypothetical protein
MQVAIVGSRKFTDYDFMCSKMALLADFLPVEGVVSGGANGADALGMRWANDHGFVPEIYPAYFTDLSHPEARLKKDRKGQWYDAAAGMRRNQTIVDKSDVVVAFMDLEHPTPGTSDTLEKARRAGKTVFVYWRSE